MPVDDGEEGVEQVHRLGGERVRVDRHEAAGQHVEGKLAAVDQVSRKCSARWKIKTRRRRTKEMAKMWKKGGVGKM